MALGGNDLGRVSEVTPNEVGETGGTTRAVGDWARDSVYTSQNENCGVGGD